MNIREMPFARTVLLTALILELLWFFMVWAASFKTPSAAVVGAILLPVFALVFRLLPEEKRALCTEKDLKLLNDLARGAFFATAAFSVMMLLGVWKYLSVSFIEKFMFYVLIGQFSLHVFAVLICSCLAVLAPRDSRKKPLKLAITIYIVSTLMQMVVFPETMLAIQSSLAEGR